MPRSRSCPARMRLVTKLSATTLAASRPTKALSVCLPTHHSSTLPITKKGSRLKMENLATSDKRGFGTISPWSLATAELDLHKSSFAHLNQMFSASFNFQIGVGNPFSIHLHRAGSNEPPDLGAAFSQRELIGQTFYH